MKVVLVPFCFYPEPVGGTEVYVAELAHALQEEGHQVLVIAPGTTSASYSYDRIRVRRFSVVERGDLRRLYGPVDETVAMEFCRILIEERADLLHLHGYTNTSPRLVQAAKKCKIPVVFTYHTPTGTCQRGTLMRWGTVPCDGLMDVRGCASCTLHGLGLNRVASSAMGCVPRGVGSLLGRLGLKGGAWTAVRMTELMQLRHETTRTFLQETDHIVAVCEWARRLLMRNGVPASKLTLSRHGILQTQKALGQNAACFGADPTVDSKPTCLRLAFLGRFDPAKGGEILIRAVRRLADAPLRLDIYGVSQGQGGQSHESQLRALAATDERIHFFPTLARGEVSLKLRRYDLLAVPSQWLETGPLVVLEAFSAGVPVIGSRLGGVAELVADGVDGLLVESGNSEAWANALRRLLDTPVLVRSLRDGVRPPRSMRTVATEMLELYNRIC